MPNPHRGEATLELTGEKPRTIVIDFNAVAEIVAETGVSPDQIAEAHEHGKSLVFMRAALAAGLSRDHKRMTPRQAGDLIGSHLDEMGTIASAVSTALKRYFVGPNESKPPEVADDRPLPTPAAETPIAAGA